MASKSAKFSVGLFVIAGLIICVSVVLYFGLSNVLSKAKIFAAYFDESVQGLDKDSSVKYRGVAVGRVDAIRVAPDNNLIEVLLRIDPDLELNKNVVAKLKSVGITGIMFVELDTLGPEDPSSSPELSFKPDYPVINTKPSDLKRTFDTLDNILVQLNSLDVQGISDRAKSTLDSLNTTINDLQMKEISQNIQNTFKKLEEILSPDQWQALMNTTQASGKSLEQLIGNMNRTVARLDKIATENEDELSRSLKNFTASMENANRFLSQGADLIEETDETVQRVRRQVTATLQQLEQASRNLNRTMEQVADQPSVLLFSKPLPEER
jgi:phospholipid/cholesterol/gamma-HCH transport system substrate-binding protein